MNKNKKDFYLNLFTFVGLPIIFIAGALLMGFYEYTTLGTLGAFLFFIGMFVFMFRLLIIVAEHFGKKKKRKENKARSDREKLIDDARQAFEAKDRPETNTIRVTEAGVEFFAEGKYACEKDLKNVAGNHFAFEIRSVDLKTMPENHDAVEYLERTGILVEVGYINGDAMAEYANDNGVILQDTLENSIGSTIPLQPDGDYNAYIWTAEGDDIDYGFVKILGLENDVLTVYFSLTAPYAICDAADGATCRTVEGVVELKKDTVRQTNRNQSLIDKIKKKRLKTTPLGNDEAQSIKQANPFLPDSYITFLKEIGFIDFNWIDVERNSKTATDLNDEQTESVDVIISDRKSLNSDDYYFIGVDNAGRHYAFSKNADDKKVYVFSDDASEITTYETFEKFVSEILSV